jgi:hypothetical protein
MRKVRASAKVGHPVWLVPWKRELFLFFFYGPLGVG